MTKRNVKSMRTGNPFSTGVVPSWGLGLRESNFRFEKPDDKGTKTPTPEEQNAVLQNWLAEQTAGLRGNRDTILKEKQTAEEKLLALKDQWKGLDPERVRQLVTRFENDAEMKLIEEGKIDEVIAMRTENLRTEMETRLTAATGKIDEQDSLLGRKNDTIASLVIDAKVREIGATMDPPLETLAVPDAIRAARDVFSLGEDDQPVARNTEGAPVIGKDGRTPLGIEEWLQTAFEGEKTLWWPGSNGGGSTGSGDGNRSRGKEIDPDTLSSRQKLEFGLPGNG